MQAYPTHPEVFERLYEDWSTLEGFQRSRGVLKLMAKVIYRLWKDQNQDLLIMPGSLPLYDGDRTAIGAMTYWNDVERYLYLPRLKNRAVLEQAITKGAATKDFFGTAYGQNGESFDGFKFGDPWVQPDDTLVLIEPESARQYEEKTLVPGKDPQPPVVAPDPGQPTPNPVPPNPGEGTGPPLGGTPPAPSKAREFFGAVEINPSTAKMRMVDVADEIISIPDTFDSAPESPDYPLNSKKCKKSCTNHSGERIISSGICRFPYITA